MSDKPEQKKPIEAKSKPNEVGPIQVTAYLKIIDPATKEIIVEKKG
jgi:hypothetical protein